MSLKSTVLVAKSELTRRLLGLQLWNTHQDCQDLGASEEAIGYFSVVFVLTRHSTVSLKPARLQLNKKNSVR